MPRRFMYFFLVVTCLLGVPQAFAAPDPAKISCVATTLGTTESHFRCTLQLDKGWKIIHNQDKPPLLFHSQDPHVTAGPFPPYENLKTDFGPQQGYKDRVDFPMHVTHAHPPFTVHGTLSMDLCAHMCMPLELPLTLSDQTPLAEAPATNDFWMIALFALLGGFILNFMPCVLPVLSLKIMSVAKRAKEARQDVHHRLNFLATFVGIMTSFWILGGTTIILDQMGTQVGWGLHFQQPSFLSFMIVLVTLFACSLWGFFEILLPSGVQNGLYSLLGGRFKNAPIFVEDFLGGVLATLLATPCTAPFLGTAIGAAFLRPAPEIFLMFTLMGLGFGVPYVIGMALPLKALHLPKPGAWMMKLSKILGGLLALTALWLLAVLAAHHRGMALVLALLCVGMVFSFSRSKRLAKRRQIAFILAGLGLLTPLLTYAPDFVRSPASTQASYWQTFAPKSIAEHVRQGHVVVINVTANWCLTCKLNDQRVFHTAAGEALLTQENVIAMRGDWSKKNTEIFDFLTAHKRRGIPFTAVFGKGAPQGLVLSEILSVTELKESLEKARGSSL